MAQSIDELTGLVVDECIRIDLLIEQRLIVEIKSVEALKNLHAKQLLTYLRLTDREVGLLLNFSGETMKEGIRRVVNDHGRTRRPSAPPRLCESKIGET